MDLPVSTIAKLGFSKETEPIGCISYKEFAHAIMEAEKAQGQ